MVEYRTLYIDMNSFFASVEQELNPDLRGKPLAITAMENDAGCVVAASYEAKAYGVSTGTRVYDAKKLCPGIQFRPSRHRLYVRFNQKIAEVVDQIAEVERVRSVDEFQIGLSGGQTNLDVACKLALDIKQAIFNEVGSQLRCSIGIGPNHLLAKVAGKLIKPDGLEWLSSDNLPERLSDLALDELPGISNGTMAKLGRAGIFNFDDLYKLDPRHARLIWKSVEGERFVRALQGEFIPLLETKRGGYGNSKVLAPEFRPRPKARLVGRWLIEKAAERMRRDQYCTKRVGLSLRFVSSDSWFKQCNSSATQDTRQILRIYENLWEQMDKTVESGRLVTSIHVQLGNILPLAERPGELFSPEPPGCATTNERLSSAVDRINRKYKKKLVKFGVNQEHPGFFERG